MAPVMTDRVGHHLHTANSTSTATDTQRAVGTEPRIGTVNHFVADCVALFSPCEIRWVSDIPQDRAMLLSRLTQAGTLTQLNPSLRPNSYLARSTPDDVARLEHRTFICGDTAQSSGLQNNWMPEHDMKQLMLNLFHGSMRGRTMYVVPFAMGNPQSERARFGVQVTDSAYVALSMLTMTRATPDVARAIRRGAEFVPGLHSVGFPLIDDSGANREDVAWPANAEKYIAHFPRTSEIWSFGSGYGGNALLGKKCLSLRIASSMGKNEGWLAEHMLLIRARSPHGKTYHFVGSFPSACGKTNLAMLQPALPGWSIQTIGDDIVWMWVDATGRLRAMNPENGFFGVAPGTSHNTNPTAMKTIARDTIFTNVALTHDSDVWWEGMTDTPPDSLTDWQGNPWNPETGPAAHPNSRFMSSVSTCPSVPGDWDAPQGVPVDGIIFGGRRASTVPLVAQAHSWEHGVLMGACIVSERTAAAEGTVGELRSDPFAMAPFLGYDYTEHWSHWLSIGKKLDAAHLPQIFHVNWFRKDTEGGFLWPGFGENIRVLEWMTTRIDAMRDNSAGQASTVPHPLGGSDHGSPDCQMSEGHTTPAGYVPTPAGLNLDGLDESTRALATRAVRVEPDEWRSELQRQRQFLEDQELGAPPELCAVLDELGELL